MLAGRYVPQLDFLEVALGDEPVLAPEEHFYQRLLAMDTDDARNIAESYLQDKPLESLYESVIVPALALAEQDRHVEVIDDQMSENITLNTKELIEDLGERSELKAAETSAVEGGSNGHATAVRLDMPGVVCIPAGDNADELVAMMLAQLLHLGGSRASYIPIGPVHDIFEQITQSRARIACVSALPPFAASQARAMCKRLSGAFPEIKVVIGLWNFPGGIEKAQERIGTRCSDSVATTLTEAIVQIRRLAQSTVVEKMKVDPGPEPARYRSGT